MSTRAAVITCSDSVARSLADAGAPDRSGPLAAQLLRTLGYVIADQVIVPDDVDVIQGAIRSAIEAGCRVVVCTGGTGVGPRDVTPDAVEGLGGRRLPGVGEAIRAASRDRVPTTDLSRAGAVAVGRSLVLLLPGSPGGVRDGLTVAGPLLDHAVSMLNGEGHGTHGRRRDEAVVDVRAQTAVGASPAGPLGSDTDVGPAVSDPGPSVPASVGPDAIEAAALVRAVERRAAGAIVTFEGRVRDHDGGRPVTSLTYEAHPDAATVLAGVVTEATARPGVQAAVAAHRTDVLEIGDLAFFVAVAAAHRGEAFEACAWLVDQAKARTPIWKHQVFADGAAEWVNCP